MLRLLGKRKFTTASVAATIVTVFLGNLNITLARDKHQMATLYTIPLPLPRSIVRSQALTLNGSYWRDLAVANFDNKAYSACVSGILLLYDKPNFNAQPGRVEYIYGPNGKCENLQHLRGKVSSTRFAGLSADSGASTITMYQWDYFQGMQEFSQTNRPLVTLDGSVKSLIITGPSPWTLYSMPNYQGEVACVRSEFPSPAFIYDVNKVGLPRNFMIRSIRHGCFTNDQENQITVHDQSFTGHDEDDGGFSPISQIENQNQIVNPTPIQFQREVQSFLQKQAPKQITSPLKPEKIQNIIKDEILKQTASLINVLIPNPNPLLFQATNQNFLQESSSTLSTVQIQNELQKQLLAAGLPRSQSQTSPSLSQTGNQNQNPNSNFNVQQKVPSEKQIQDLIQTEIQKQLQAIEISQKNEVSTPSPTTPSPTTPSPIVIQIVSQTTPKSINPVPVDKLVQSELQNQIQATIQSQIQKQMDAIITDSQNQIPSPVQSVSQTLEIQNQIRNLIQSEVQNEVLRIIQSQNQLQNLNLNANPGLYFPSQSVDPFYTQNLLRQRNFNNGFNNVARLVSFRNLGRAVGILG